MPQKDHEFLKLFIKEQGFCNRSHQVIKCVHADKQRCCILKAQAIYGSTLNRPSPSLSQKGQTPHFLPLSKRGIFKIVMKNPTLPLKRVYHYSFIDTKHEISTCSQLGIQLIKCNKESPMLSYGRVGLTVVTKQMEFFTTKPFKT